MTEARAAKTRLAPAERDALADLLEAVGPDAPTLCEGWTTRDLAAHLVVRGSRVDVAGGIFLKPLAGPLRRAQDAVARRPWPTLVAQVRRRPWWAPGPLDEAANGVEYFVHHEDIRRAQPDWQPRALPTEVSATLWSRLELTTRMALRRIQALVTIHALTRETDHGTRTGGGGGPAARIAGEPQELLLFLMGRQAHAHVDVTGPDALVHRLRTAHFGV